MDVDRRKTATIRKSTNKNGQDESKSKGSGPSSRRTPDQGPVTNSQTSNKSTPCSQTGTPVDPDDHPYIENLFLKLKEDREKAGIPLHPEDDHSSKSDTPSSTENRVSYPEKINNHSINRGQQTDTVSESPGSTENHDEIQDDTTISDQDYLPSSTPDNTVTSSSVHAVPTPKHKPALSPIETPIPSTPSSLCISPWEESIVDGDEEARRRSNEDNVDKMNTLNMPLHNPLSADDILSTDSETDGEKWQDDKTLAECNMHMLVNDINCDVTMMVGTEKQEVIKAHSFILSSRSPEFAKILRSEAYIKSQLLTFDEIRLDVFQSIIRYIYTDDTYINTDHALAIIPATGIVGPRALRSKCLRYLLGEMSSDLACVVLEYAYSYNHFNEYYKCLKFILVNAVDVFNEDNFYDLSPRCVDDITKSNDLNADEFTVFEALVKWAGKECVRKETYPINESKREILGLMIYNVRFATLDADDFNTRFSKRGVLKPEETTEIFQILHSKTGYIPDYIDLQPRRQYNIKYHLQGNFNNGNDYLPNRSENSKSSKDKSNTHKASSKKMKTIVPDILLPIRRVVRFQRFGDTWEKDGADAIAFRVSVPIVFRGVQIFGPGDDIECYNVDVKLFDDVDNVIRSDRIMIEPTLGKTLYDVILEQPARIPKDRFFVIQLVIHCKPTVEGAEGVKVLNSDGDIFEFKTVENRSPKTSVNRGQIPSILFSRTD